MKQREKDNVTPVVRLRHDCTFSNDHFVNFVYILILINLKIQRRGLRRKQGEQQFDSCDQGGGPLLNQSAGIYDLRVMHSIPPLLSLSRGSCHCIRNNLDHNFFFYWENCFSRIKTYAIFFYCSDHCFHGTKHVLMSTRLYLIYSYKTV